MGSIEVFDYQQMKWVPYKPNSYQTNQSQSNQANERKEEAMTQELKDTKQKLQEAEDKLKRLNERPPKVKQVTPVAEALERAKSEVTSRQNRELNKARQFSTKDWSQLKY